LPAFPSIMLLPLLLSGVSKGGEVRPVQLAQLSIEQRVIIRIPTMPTPPTPSESQAGTRPPAVEWKESKGRSPRCLPLNLIRAAVINSENGVTMVVSARERYRTHFARSCRPADFYAGFYVSPNEDGVLCAGRDTLHARNGSACQIERFSRMVAHQVQPEPSDKGPGRGDD